MDTPCIIRADDEGLIRTINSARQRLVYVAPGVSKALAAVLADAWKRLGPGAVNVILDVDPEVCRLGYGTLDGLKTLQETARGLHAEVRYQPGVRIGLVVADDQMLVYTPTPLLIEAGTTQQAHPNALWLGTVPASVAREVGLGENPDLERRVGRDVVRPDQVTRAEEDLKSNPPVSFDVARRIRVFNAQFEFVELSVTGCELHKRRPSLPSELLGITDPKTQRQVRNSLVLFDDDSTVSGKRVMALKEWIVKRYLILLPTYGSVVLRRNKHHLERAVAHLRYYIDRFRQQAEDSIEAELIKARESLCDALLPAIRQNPPKDWRKFIGDARNDADLRRLLDHDLRNALGSAKQYLGEMKVKMVFKGVTYESLNDADFVKAVQKAIPTLDVAHEEYDAAPEARARLAPF